jgi:hypothetical protein
MFYLSRISPPQSASPTDLTSSLRSCRRKRSTSVRRSSIPSRARRRPYSRRSDGVLNQRFPSVDLSMTSRPTIVTDFSTAFLYSTTQLFFQGNAALKNGPRQYSPAGVGRPKRGWLLVSPLLGEDGCFVGHYSLDNAINSMISATLAQKTSKVSMPLPPVS